MAMILSGKPKSLEVMVLMYQRERCVHILCNRSQYFMTMTLTGKQKILENIVLMYQRERCKHILYTPFLLLYDYNFECNTENYRKYGSHVETGTVYTHSVYTVPVTI